jgi:hypothetical protein
MAMEVKLGMRTSKCYSNSNGRFLIFKKCQGMYHLREIGFGDVDWIHLAQDMDRWRALVNTVMRLRVP